MRNLVLGLGLNWAHVWSALRLAYDSIRVINS